MEHKVEKILGRSLLASDLEVTLLESLEVTHAIVCKEIQAELD